VWAEEEAGVVADHGDRDLMADEVMEFSAIKA